MKLKLTKETKNILDFTTRLVLFSIPFFFLVVSGYQIPILMETSHNSALFLIESTGIPATVSENLIIIPTEGGEWAAFVSWDSSGWKSILVLFALIMATNVAIKKKLYGLLLIPVLYGINIIRIWFMFWLVHTQGLTYYDFLHATLWSWGMIIALLALWLVWKRWTEGKTVIPKSILPRFW
jgi:exosortase/archaeosortase family protein